MDALSVIRPESTQLEQGRGTVRVRGIDLGTTNSTMSEIMWRAVCVTRKVELWQRSTNC